MMLSAMTDKLCVFFAIIRYLKNMSEEDSLLYIVVYFHYLTALRQKDIG